jgi:hypothetical protein
MEAGTIISWEKKEGNAIVLQRLDILLQTYKVG